MEAAQAAEQRMTRHMYPGLNESAAVPLTQIDLALTKNRWELWSTTPFTAKGTLGLL